MTPRERRFVAEYLVDLNGAQAAIRAGYSERRANATAYKLLRRPAVAAALGQAMAEREARTRITADRVLKEYARIAFADIRRLTEWGPKGVALRPDKEVSEDDAAAIAELIATPDGKGGGPKLKLHDKKSALDTLARHLGLLGRPGIDAGAPGAGEADRARERLRRRIAELARRKGEG